MTIQVGDRLPQTTFRVMTADGAKPKTTDDVFAGRKVVLIGVPGAFTPTCHRNHLPGYIENAASFTEMGVDAIAVTAVNDVFVMAEDARLRAARLTLMADLRDLILELADISEIVLQTES